VRLRSIPCREPSSGSQLVEPQEAIGYGLVTAFPLFL